MPNHIFHNMVLSEDKHVLQSRFTDHEIYSYIDQDMFLPFEDRLVDHDRQLFQKYLVEEDSHWFFVRLKEHDNTIILRYLKRTKEGYWFTVADGQAVMDTAYCNINLIDSYLALTSLYGDVYFIGNMSDKKFLIRSTGAAKIKSGEYDIDEFYAELKKHSRESDQSAITEWIEDMLMDGGRGSKLLSGNLVDEDPAVQNTMINYCTVAHRDGTASVVGTMHAERARASKEHPAQERDGLTGLYAKKEIEKIAKQYCAAKDGRMFTIGIIDVDFFKNVNDTYGHAIGDVVLKKVASIIQNEIGPEGVAGRFGGDEFFVIANTTEEEKLRTLFSGIHTQVSAAFPNYGLDQNRLTLSIGSACYPENSTDYDSLFFLADHCLYIAKKKGRDRYIMYTPAKHGTVEEIMRSSFSGEQIGSRENEDPAEMLVNMVYRFNYGDRQSIESLLKEFANGLHLQNVMLAKGHPCQIQYTAGYNAVTDPEALKMIAEQMTDQKIVQDIQDFMIVSSIEYMGQAEPELKTCFRRYGIESFVAVRFEAKQNEDAFLILTSIGRKQKWNRLHIKYYRLFTDLLKKYDF